MDCINDAPVSLNGQEGLDPDGIRINNTHIVQINRFYNGCKTEC